MSVTPLAPKMVTGIGVLMTTADAFQRCTSRYGVTPATPLEKVPSLCGVQSDRLGSSLFALRRGVPPVECFLLPGRRSNFGHPTEFFDVPRGVRGRVEVGGILNPDMCEYIPAKPPD